MKAEFFKHQINKLHLRTECLDGQTYVQREKCPNTEFLLVRIFPHPALFSPNAGKCGPEKTPYLDTFHAVQPHKQDSYKYMLKRLNNTDKGSDLQLFRTPTADRTISLGGIKRNYGLLNHIGS